MERTGSKLKFDDSCPLNALVVTLIIKQDAHQLVGQAKRRITKI